MKYQTYQLASALSPKEWRLFVEDAAGASRPLAPDLAPMISALRGYHPDFEITDEVLWGKAFPDRPYDNGRLRVLRSYLKDMLEDRIVLLELASNKTMKQLVLLEGLLNRECLDAAERLLAHADKGISRPAMRLYAMEHLLRLDEKRLDLAVRTFQVGSDYPWDSLLDQVQDLAIAKRMRLLAAMVGTWGFQTLESKKIEVALKMATEGVDVQALDRQPFVAIYYHLLCLLLGQGTEASYPTLKLLLSTHGSEMERTEMVNVFALLINYLLEQDRRRVKGSVALVFETYQEMHRQDLLFGLGAFTEAAVRSILRFGTQLGEIAWTRAFFEEASHRLPESDREQIWHYGLAMLDFAEQKYSDSKRHLAQLVFSTPSIRLSHDNLSMRISYETNDADAFEAVSAKLLRHLYRKERIAKSTKLGAINLAKAIATMFDFRWNPNTKRNLATLKQNLAKLTPISHLDWIQAKLLELEVLHEDHGSSSDL